MDRTHFLVRIARLAVLAVATGVAACSSDATAPGPDSAADVAIGDVAPYVGPAFESPSASVGPETRAQECPFNAERQRFVCGPVVRNGLTHVHAFAFFDAAGAIQRRYDALTTETIAREGIVEGTLSRENATIKINHRVQTRISGLAGANATFIINSVGRDASSTEIALADGRSSTAILAFDTTANVVMPVHPRESARPAAAWPLSGTRIFNVTVRHERTGRPTFTTHRREEITYNGTNLVPVKLSVNGATRSCIRDLSAPRSRDC